MNTFEENLDNFFINYQGQVPGAVIGYVHNKKIFTKCYGLGNLDDQRSVTTHTTFRLASLTKAFTAACILKLVEENALKLNNCINDIIDDFPDYGKKISIKNLLQHTSGLKEYHDSGSLKQLTDNDVLNQLKNLRNTEFTPGEKYEYSNSGYVLLGIIVNHVSGASLPDFMHETIFKPLKMDDTVLFLEGKNEIKNRAYGYKSGINGFKLNDQSNASALLGDGGVYSSITDMIKWDQSLYTDKILSLETWNQVFTNGVLNNGEKTAYGYGWHLMDYLGYSCIYHSGSTVGFRNLIVRIPDRRLTFIILTNRDTVEIKSTDKNSLLGAKEDLFKIFVSN
ncbi:beta-lactamase family protein [Candidatus Bathyarchaeota archaeon]|nr:beta-lactamase family protein [Candidatus Bathyarchaeota archaeon]